MYKQLSILIMLLLLSFSTCFAEATFEKQQFVQITSTMHIVTLTDQLPGLFNIPLTIDGYSTFLTKFHIALNNKDNAEIRRLGLMAQHDVGILSTLLAPHAKNVPQWGSSQSGTCCVFKLSDDEKASTYVSVYQDPTWKDATWRDLAVYKLIIQKNEQGKPVILVREAYNFNIVTRDLTAKYQEIWGANGYHNRSTMWVGKHLSTDGEMNMLVLMSLIGVFVH